MKYITSLSLEVIGGDVVWRYVASIGRDHQGVGGIVGLINQVAESKAEAVSVRSAVGGSRASVRFRISNMSVRGRDHTSGRQNQDFRLGNKEVSGSQGKAEEA